jgi:hypothetical protein
LIIAGDSGVGKSELLNELRSHWALDDIVAGAAVLGSTSNSLQTAFVDAVGDCLRQYSVQSPDSVVNIWNGLLHLFDTASSATAKQAGQMVIARLFTSIEMKLGKEMADSARTILTEVLQPASRGLDDRLQELTHPDLATELITVASDLSEMTGRRLILRFDRAELLNDADLALLGELADRSIDSLLIVVTYSTVRRESLDVLTTLETRGARVHELQPLHEAEIHQWLESELVPKEMWTDLIRLTGGYPFFLQDAIQLSKAGQTLQDLKLPRGFTSLLKLSWGTLDPIMQAIAMKLSAFNDPPSDDFVAQLLDVDRVAWATIRNQLIAVGVFVSRPDRTVWFHDRRRAYIWHTMMNFNERAAVADAGVRALKAWQNDSTQIASWTLLAVPELIRSAEQEVTDGFLAALLQTSLDELSILCAIVELIEPDSLLNVFVETASVGNYSASVFGRPQDSISSLERLAAVGLIVSTADSQVSLTTLIIPDSFSYAALLAEFEHRLRRSCKPRFASTVFRQALKPLLGNFDRASVSVGHGSLRTHRNVLSSLCEGSEPRRLLSQSFGLGIELEVSGQRITSTVLFRSEKSRDDARVKIEEDQENCDPNEAKILDLVELPPSRIKYGRFHELANRLGVDRSTETLASPMDVIEHARRRISSGEVLRQGLSVAEASSIGWTNTRSSMIDTSSPGNGWSEITVSGGLEAAVKEFELASVGSNISDPLLSLKLRKAGLLAQGEQLLGWAASSDGSHISSRPHALKVAADDLFRAGRAFNKSLRRVRITLDASELERAIFLERAWTAAIFKRLSELDLVEIPARHSFRTSIHLFVQLSSGLEGSQSLRANYYEFDDDGAGVAVTVLPESAPAPPWRPTEEEAIALGLPSHQPIYVGGGVATDVVARMLGYTGEDIYFWQSNDREWDSKGLAWGD